jgi:ABC-type dipeptide/oligopeptide/nickel transport system permease component
MKQVGKKLLTLIITLLVVSLLAFLAFQIIPGDPTTKMLGTNATPEKAALLRRELGLDRPVFVRYFEWLFQFVRGKFGTSYTYKMPVSDMLSDKLPVTVLLTVFSFVLTVLLSIPLGILSGSRHSQAADHLSVILSQIIMAVPPFFFGIIACYVFGIVLRWFLPGNFIPLSESVIGCMGYLFLPALSLALPRIAMTVRMLRGSIRDELTENYVLTAKSRGLSRREILLRHVLRNAMIPVVTFLAVSAAEIMTGTIIIEQVFTIPGIGRLLVSSIGNRDYPVVQAIVVLLAAWIMIVNFLADLVNHWMDPRLRS